MAVGLSIMITGLFGIFIHPTVIFGWRAPDLGWLAWIYLVPLFVILKPLHGARRFFASFFSALIFYPGSLYWLVAAMKNFGGLSFAESFGVLFLITLILAFYFAAALSTAYRVHERTGIPLFLSSASFLMAADFLRTYFPAGGFPWSMPAYSQGAFLPFFQWVDVTGVYGLNFLIYLVNGLVAEMIVVLIMDKEKDHLLNRFVILVLLVMVSFFGSYRQQRKMEEKGNGGETRQIALIQGNIDQELKWNPKKALKNLQRHLLLSDRAIAAGADLVVWPETAFPYTVDLSRPVAGSIQGERDFSGSQDSMSLGLDLADNRLKQILDRDSFPVPFVFGAVSERPVAIEELPVIYNSAFLVDRDVRIRQVYHKQHLVPFGEYVPMRKWLTFARRLTVAVGDFTPGDKFTLLESGSLKIGTLICYEDIFPDLARAFTKTGANLLINLTNDAWYGHSSAQHQHLVFSQFRALENRRPLLRATNTGVTAVIDPRGEVVHQLTPFTGDILLKGVAVTERKTLYTILGDFVGWFSVIFSVAVFVVSLFKRKIPNVQRTS